MYRTIPSFQEYLPISQTKMLVEKYTKNKGNQWVLSDYVDAEDVISFASFKFEISLEEIYQNVDFATT